LVWLDLTRKLLLAQVVVEEMVTENTPFSLSLAGIVHLSFF
jgi:hypothetical protein